MSDVEEDAHADENGDEAPAPPAAGLKISGSRSNLAGLKSPTPGADAGRQHGLPDQPKTLLARQAHYSAGKPSKHDKTKLMRAEGIIRIQAGSNKFASQKGQTGSFEFGDNKVI